MSIKPLLPRVMLAVAIAYASPAVAQEPGFEAPRSQQSGEASPGFDESATRRAANFELDAVALDGARLDLSKEQGQQYARTYHGITSCEDLIAYKGVFAPSVEDRAPQLLVIDLKEDRVRLYEGSTVRAQFKDLGLVSQAEMEALDLGKRAFVAQISGEGGAELVVWRKSARGKQMSYRMSVLKVVGEYIGKAFEHEVARSHGTSLDDLTLTHSVEFYRGEDKTKPSKVIGVTAGEKTTLYKWDTWSGTFADPAKLPSAKKSSRS